MKTAIILFASLVLSFNSQAGTPAAATNNNNARCHVETKAPLIATTKKDSIVTFHEGRERDGRLIRYFANGKIQEEANFYSGYLDGKQISYYKNGAFREVANYYEGELDGKQVSYYENGNYKEVANYKDGYLDGKQVSYYENGNYKEVANYKDQRLEGKQISYYKNGNYKEVANYNGAFPNGKQVSYYENGNCKQVVNYKLGYPDGKTYTYYRDGEQASYYENGNYKEVANYKDGKLDGKQASYYKNGNYREKTNYKDGNQLSEKLLAPKAADGILQHPSKPKGDGTNIYEEFTSAQFGTAGRWMTTNLSARAYDSNIATAILPTAPNGENSDTNPQWCYPSATSPTLTTEYMTNKDLGLLYNWAAVTAATQNENDTNEDGIEYPIRQGICPNGWHVPSEKEWSELEAEFTANKSKYSSLKNNNSADNNGSAMKDVTADGASKPAREGGFAVLLTSTTTMPYAPIYGYLWTSSSSSTDSAWTRNVFGIGFSSVYSSDRNRNYLFSVRCKEDMPS